MTKLLHIPSGEFVSFVSAVSMNLRVYNIELALCYNEKLENLLTNRIEILSRVVLGVSGRLYDKRASLIIQDDSELEWIDD